MMGRNLAMSDLVCKPLPGKSLLIRAASASDPCLTVPTKRHASPHGIRDVNTDPEDTRRSRFGLG